MYWKLLELLLAKLHLCFWVVGFFLPLIFLTLKLLYHIVWFAKSVCSMFFISSTELEVSEAVCDD